jgi:hypothetical protein
MVVSTSRLDNFGILTGKETYGFVAERFFTGKRNVIFA